MTKSKKPQVVLTYDEMNDRTTVKTVGDVDAVLMMDMVHDALEVADKNLDKWIQKQREK